MPLRPINLSVAFKRWRAFSPGEWIDFNPTVVVFSDGRRIALFRRDQVPPTPGEGSIWAVEVSDKLDPLGDPFLMVRRGEDPRGVVIDDRLFLFFVTIEKNQLGRATGSQMHVAEFRLLDNTPEPLYSFVLPKNPTGAAHLAGTQWEKNWVPFHTQGREIALIYSHDPWVVLILEVCEAGSGGAPRLVTAYSNPGIQWPHGEIRGGTPPLAFDDQHLITFFHSSQVIGSRNVYMVGACIFERASPFRPILLTTDPLLVAPYHSTVQRFGWPVLASVIFPLGAQKETTGYTLLCGLDDGEVGVIGVPHEALGQRLAAVKKPAQYHLQDASGANLATGLTLPVFLSEHPTDQTNAVRLSRFLAQLVNAQSEYVAYGDSGAMHCILVSPHARQCHLHTGSDATLAQRNVGLNQVANVTLHKDSIGLNSVSQVGLLHLCLASNLSVPADALDIVDRFQPVVVVDSAAGIEHYAQLHALLRLFSYRSSSLFALTPNVKIFAPDHSIAAHPMWLSGDWAAL
jgi:predicted GH43/DUF377 family glycosyl hydrolase